MTLTRAKTYETDTLKSAPQAGENFRLLYADHVPVRRWTVWFAENLEDINKKALRQANADLRPASGVYDNVFIIQRWTGEEWDDYNEDGEDLTELVFDEVENT